MHLYIMHYLKILPITKQHIFLNLWAKNQTVDVKLDVRKCKLSFIVPSFFCNYQGSVFIEKMLKPYTHIAWLCKCKKMQT